MSAPALAVTQPDGSRKYVHPVTGETVPSVTTCLKYISKPNLDGWAARLTAQYALANWDELSGIDPMERLDILKDAHNAERQVKADRGTLVHELCENFSKGSMPEVPKEANGYITQFFQFLDQKKPVYIEAEATMWNHQYGYAGTCDAIAMIDGAVCIIDIKTGPRCYPEYGLQLSALSHCECIVDEDGNEWEMPRIEKHMLLNLRPRSWKLIEVRETEACFGAFLAARKIAHWQEEVSGRVLP